MVAVRVFVSDVARSTEFYEQALGFALIETWGGAISIMERDDLQIWLSGPSTSAAKPWTDGTQPVPGSFTRFVLPLKDWEVFEQRIIENGGRVANGPISGPGGSQVVILDPDGNSIELFSND